MSQRTVIGLAASAIMVAGCFALIPWFGGAGAALVRLITFTAMCCMMVRLLQLDGSLRGMFMSIAKVTLASLLCGGMAYSAVSVVNGITGLVAAILLGILVYITALRLLNAVPQDDIIILRQIASRLPRRALPIATHALDLLSPRRI